jgi:hypothetical protein
MFPHPTPETGGELSIGFTSTQQYGAAEWKYNWLSEVNAVYKLRVQNYFLWVSRGFVSH